MRTGTRVRVKHGSPPRRSGLVEMRGVGRVNVAAVGGSGQSVSHRQFERLPNKICTLKFAFSEIAARLQHKFYRFAEARACFGKRRCLRVCTRELRNTGDVAFRDFSVHGGQSKHGESSDLLKVDLRK